MAVFPVDCGNGALILLKLRTTGELQYTALHEGVAPTTLVLLLLDLRVLSGISIIRSSRRIRTAQKSK